MIPRYTRKEAAAVWAPQTRFKIMFEIEAMDGSNIRIREKAVFMLP